ncbi:methionine ABC transporter ATP-binding protein [Ruegeria profundi]|uniref:Methionine ABC transporter ATP-binding protein n=1 Tax=Ruegeria profundi TaxID=1685378 RepID=A0A0X3U0R4_9RHOB|nr:ATP-binding cassette domain-containing protein [Ruegeria profundi]KUJ79250.1 methionine ABC transporter ATP-binding protein [Ruegeria profundi]
MSAALRLNDLNFAWPGAGHDILHIKSLALQKGESLFLYGPSGCGKSTLLAAIAGTVNIAPGAIVVAGKDVGAMRGGARDRFRGEHLGMIFQVFNLVPWLSALENVVLPCRYSANRARRAAPDPSTAAQDLLTELGLADPAVAGAQAGSLSVGQQQRVAAARALIGKPSLILADEPTSALDEDAKIAFVELLQRECRQAESALLFVSHDRSLENHFDRAVSFSEINLPLEKTC